MQTAANDIKKHQERFTALGVMRFLCVGAASLLIGITAAWLLVSAWIGARSTVMAAGPASSDELLAFTAASLALAIAGWLVLGTVLELLSHVPGRVGRISRVWAARLTPALARRVAAFVLGVGVSVAGGPTQAVASERPTTTASSIADPGFVPAHPAAGEPVVDPGFSPSATAPGFTPTPVGPGFTPEPQQSIAPPSPGFTPTAPRVRPQADPGLLGGRVRPASDSDVVVHRGDTLWSIAARHLGPRASDAEIARAWPQWFDLNRGLIGNDPDLILPGQILRVPDADTTASVH